MSYYSRSHKFSSTLLAAISFYFLLSLLQNGTNYTSLFVHGATEEHQNCQSLNNYPLNPEEIHFLPLNAEEGTGN
jgi:hypothetical protein